MGVGSIPSLGVARLHTRLDGVLELVGSSSLMARMSVGVSLRNVVIEQLPASAGSVGVSPDTERQDIYHQTDQDCSSQH